MNEQLKNLIQLQDLDSEIIKLENEKNKLPEEKEEQKVLLEDFKEQIEQLQKELKEIQVKQNEKEIDLQSQEEKINKLQFQLNEVKDNKSYQLLQNEIESLRADNSVIEEDILKILDEVDQKEREISKKEEEIEQLKKDVQQHVDEINQRINQVDKKITELRSKRDKFIPFIDKKLLDKYERILRNKKDSVAVVPIRNGSCQGCFMTLPPQTINEVRKDDKIVICENCSRILYIEEEIDS